jgi:hypothetical protein
VQENIARVRIEFGALHAGSDCTGKRPVYKKCR